MIGGDPLAPNLDDQPNGGAKLGLATTRQLLEELRARGEMAHTIADTGQRRADTMLLWTLPAHLLSWLPHSLLDYRTVDSR